MRKFLREGENHLCEYGKLARVNPNALQAMQLLGFGAADRSPCQEILRPSRRQPTQNWIFPLLSERTTKH
jgi:hypothetical protein